MVLRCWPVGAETMAPAGMDGVEDWDEVLEEEMESCNAAVEPIASESCGGGGGEGCTLKVPWHQVMGEIGEPTKREGETVDMADAGRILQRNFF